ncbi:autotransporter outer membrane beta-barrel domain-containing protein [Aquabacter cavernae]|uniref:autotransporter outer membrane beta-barrel domain-containing protein n=1 Tax=Aquabacter cavernae TaxID=2496029 RepID=UPI000F8D15E7|nr:autotransporter outer membrane beta-barrel domain-containing protein [Aquabacter cavernae]
MEKYTQKYFSFTGRGNRFLNGVCTAALLSGSALLANGAQAGEKIIDQVHAGKDGEAWHWVTNADRSRTAVNPTPGEDAPGVSVTDQGMATTSATSMAVDIGARGGIGAMGGSYHFSMGGREYYLPGQKGGSAGDVDATLAGTVSGKGAQTTGTALLSIYSIGGDGRVGYLGEIGTGGSAGKVTLSATGAYSTEGANFSAIWARSTAGQTGRNEKYRDMGDYRMGTGSYLQTGVDAAYAHLFPGATAGEVSVSIRGEDTRVSTAGATAPAVIVESIGGAGIDGATVRRILPGAGAAGPVSFFNEGTITTDGANSAGVLLQSVGGRGGTQLFGASDDSATVGATGGGRGGNGGNAGSVEAVQNGTIVTQQDYSFGLAAYSIGGAGGDGALGYRRDGGSGGNAGNGGSVFVDHNGSIETHGIGSIGLLAQSLGGGSAVNAFQTSAVKPGTAASAGKGGGSSGVIFADKGGRGGAGGDGKAVSISQSGDIVTYGAGAFGLLAQSVGGGGGKGGNSSNTIGWQLGTAAGGDGGGGGNGGDVLVILSADETSDTPSITTFGKSASALIAQSIGGGGGAGGTAKTTTGGGLAIAFAIGGSGGDGGNGSAVRVDSAGAIVTEGRSAIGIEATSIGGGGGKGGDASAYAIAATPPKTVPAVAVSFAVGGSGGKGGSADTVSVTNSGSVATHGDLALGIRSMSVGGGGGDGGVATSVADMLGVYQNVSITVALGGTGEAGGDGGTASAINSGQIYTTGQFATALQAVSLGGGGGEGGMASATTSKGVSVDKSFSYLNSVLPTAEIYSVKATIGGSSKGGGSGAAVELTNSGVIQTTGTGSRGILAQSIGGGGGNAGGYLGGSSGDLNVQVSLGGSGGAGGAGSTVNVRNESRGVIVTQGDGSVAIHAQSIGGGGGTGGSASSTKGAKATVAPTVSDYIFKATDAIFTANKVLAGQFANEVDLFKKEGNTQKGVGYAKHALKGLKAAIETGTKSGSGTAAAIAEAYLQGTAVGGLSYVTSEFNSRIKALLKDSFNVKPGSVPASATVDVKIGGSGGSGGSGNTVTVFNAGTLLTYGNVAHGVLAQSIGGGGGTGGGAVTISPDILNLKMDVGAKGDAGGGKGGDAFAENRGRVETWGGAAFGLFAQSVGGGGGVGIAAANASAGNVSLTTVLGGTPSRSASGRSVGYIVRAENSGELNTHGKDAHGMVAQSIGLGGGAYILNRENPYTIDAIAATQDDKDALLDLTYLLEQLGISNLLTAGTKNPDTVPVVSVTASLGAVGKAENTVVGDGGSVTLKNSGSVSTEGAGAVGILAQSIGGGGGLGAIANTGTTTNTMLKLGGNGSVQGSGGTVSVALAENASVTTLGAGAAGVIIQSIGGGGGFGGSNPDGVITSRLGGTLTRPTVSNGTTTVVREELRGNGGRSEVHFGRNASVTTYGAGAVGVLVQSIGGGGGFSGYGGTGSSTILGGAMGYYGNGGPSLNVSGNGGAINVNFQHDAKIQTAGTDAPALLLQSIGGGGGLGSGKLHVYGVNDETSSMRNTYRNVAASLGTGGDITVKTRDFGHLSIQTTGARSHGIVAQSLSGGGGYSLGASIPLAKGPDSSTYRPSSWGTRAYESVTPSGTILIEIEGRIVATGADSYGIFVQNGRQNTDGSILSLFHLPSSSAYVPGLTDPYNSPSRVATPWSGKTYVTHSGVLWGGSGEGAAVRIDGGDSNIHFLRGAVVGAESGKAVVTAFGNDRLVNDGLLVGDINLGGAQSKNEFTNEETGIYQSKAGTGTLTLFAKGTSSAYGPMRNIVQETSVFTNKGTLSIGGIDTLGTLQVKGGETRLGGTMVVDIQDIGQRGVQKADLLRSDGTVRIDGVTYRPNATAITNNGYVIIAAPNVVVDRAATVAYNPASPIRWLISDWSVGVAIQPVADFGRGAAGLNLSTTDRSLITSLQKAWDTRVDDPVVAALFGSFAGISSQQDYQAALGSLSAEGQQQPAVLQTVGARGSLSAAQSCPIFIDEGVTLGETECIWSRITGSRTTQTESSTSMGFSQDGVSYRMGGQWEVAPDWFLGATAGYGMTWGQSSDGFTRSNGNAGDVSVAVKHQAGPWYFSVAAHAGYGRYELNRVFDIGADTWIAQTDSDVWTGAVRGRVAYEFGFGTWYLRPYLDLDAIYTHVPGYALSGEGATLSAASVSDWTFAVSPMLEIGTRVDLGTTGWLRPFASIGMTYYAERDMTQSVSFGDGQGMELDFESVSTVPEFLLDLGAGLQFFAMDKYELRGEYKAQIGDNFLSQEGSIRMSVRF